MTYIVNDKCIKCKLTDCVDVCPVDCFYEGKNVLVIKNILSCELVEELLSETVLKLNFLIKLINCSLNLRH